MCYYFPEERGERQWKETGGRNDRSGRRGAWFGLGLALAPFLFFPLLGFGGAVYLDGSLAAR